MTSMWKKQIQGLFFFPLEPKIESPIIFLGHSSARGYNTEALLYTDAKVFIWSKMKSMCMPLNINV